MLLFAFYKEKYFEPEQAEKYPAQNFSEECSVIIVEKLPAGKYRKEKVSIVISKKTAEAI